MDIAEKMAADIALAMDGGEWKDGKWYSKFHRDAWIRLSNHMPMRLNCCAVMQKKQMPVHTSWRKK